MLTYFQGSHKEQNRAACGGMREYETAWGITAALSRLAGETSGAYISLGSTAGYPEYQLAYEFKSEFPVPACRHAGFACGSTPPGFVAVARRRLFGAGSAWGLRGRVRRDRSRGRPWPWRRRSRIVGALTPKARRGAPTDALTGLWRDPEQIMYNREVRRYASVMRSKTQGPDSRLPIPGLDQDIFPLARADAQGKVAEASPPRRAPQSGSGVAIARKIGRKLLETLNPRPGMFGPSSRAVRRTTRAMQRNPGADARPYRHAAKACRETGLAMTARGRTGSAPIRASGIAIARNSQPVA